MKSVDETLYRKLCQAASESPRRRAHHLMHVSHADPVQRLAVVMHRGTYIRPHRHALPQTWEQFCIHRGSAVVLTFGDDGKVMERIELHAGTGPFIVEINTGQWHTLTALEDNSLLSEYKQGPFMPISEEGFSPWAPGETKPGSLEMAEWFLTAKPGESPPI
jgi:cupin fold WbuC family metalloprotein